ncbi:MAG: hypothetical protein U0136_06520 [Bdellovibrionota bacterium]
MDDKRQMLRHFLGALAYRTQKALRGAPETFGEFDPGKGVRTPKEIVRHMTGVISYVPILFDGERLPSDPLPSLNDEVCRFHEVLKQISQLIESGIPFQEGIRAEQLLQGPLSDAMSHAGQLAMLRRLAGNPIPPENFVFAQIDSERLGADQPEPARPSEVWNEAPPGWVAPSTRNKTA